MEFRHKWKHVITEADRIAIRQRMGAVGRPDIHGQGGKYLVRSLYFDNLKKGVPCVNRSSKNGQ